MIRLALLTLTLLVALTFGLSLKNTAHSLGNRTAATNAILAG